MRTWIAGLSALALFVGLATATSAAPRRTHTVKAAHHAVKASHLMYLCAECGVGADHPVACPDCKKPMGRVATYACLKDQISADFPGPCPECHQPMKKLSALYTRCSVCGFYYPKAKKSCPVCARRHHKRKH